MRSPVPVPEDFYENARDIFLDPKFRLYIDPAYERRRVDWTLPLLSEFAVLFPAPVEAPPLFPAGRCFENATKSAGVEGLVYCEGLLRGVELGTGSPFVALHAWCYDPVRKLTFDVTAGFSQSPGHVSYVGIPFNSVYVKAQSISQGFFGMLDGHPVLGDSVGPYSDPSPHWLHPCWSSLERYHGPF